MLIVFTAVDRLLETL